MMGNKLIDGHFVGQSQVCVLQAFVAVSYTHLFVKVNGSIISPITLPEGHLRYWKHEGAIAYDGYTVEIGYGTKAISYTHLRNRVQ